MRRVRLARNMVVMRRPGGFSLAECTVAVLVLAAMSVVLVGVIPSTIFGMKSAENRALAACLAREALEGMRQGDFEALASADVRTVVSNGTEFRVRVEVGPAVDSGGSPMDDERARSIQVVVSWDERGGGRSHHASTILCRYQP